MKVIDCFILLIIAISSCTDRISDDTRSKMHGVWAVSGYTADLRKLHVCNEVLRQINDTLNYIVVDPFFIPKAVNDSTFYIIENCIVNGVSSERKIKMFYENDHAVKSEVCNDGYCRIFEMNSIGSKHVFSYILTNESGVKIKVREMELLFGKDKPFGLSFTNFDDETYLHDGFKEEPLIFYDGIYIGEQYFDYLKRDYLRCNALYGIKRFYFYEKKTDGKDVLLFTASNKSNFEPYIYFSNNMDSLSIDDLCKTLKDDDDHSIYYFAVKWSSNRIDLFNDLKTSGKYYMKFD